jgi:adenylate kinase
LERFARTLEVEERRGLVDQRQCMRRLQRENALEVGERAVETV